MDWVFPEPALAHSAPNLDLMVRSPIEAVFAVRHALPQASGPSQLFFTRRCCCRIALTLGKPFCAGGGKGFPRPYAKPALKVVEGKRTRAIRSTHANTRHFAGRAGVAVDARHLSVISQ